MWYQRRSQNKYGAKSTEYNGRTYHSKLEAGYAQELDLRQKAGDIKEWIPQFKIELWLYGQHLWDYKVDFKVINNDGSIEFHEVKGFSTMEWRKTWRLLEVIYNKEHPEIKLEVIR